MQVSRKNVWLYYSYVEFPRINTWDHSRNMTKKSNSWWCILTARLKTCVTLGVESRVDGVHIPNTILSDMIRILSAQQMWNIKVLMALVPLACYHNSLRVRLYLLQAALVPPSLSPWHKLYDEGRLVVLSPHHRLNARGFWPPPLYCNTSRSHNAAATQGEAVVASAGWDVGTFTLLSG